MPEDTTVLDRAQLQKQYGVQLTRYFPEWERYLKNPDTVGLEQYQRMLDTDETIGAGFDLICLTVLTMLGKYKHEKSVRITNFVQDSIDGLREGNFNRSVYEIMTSLWAGFSVTEPVYRAEGIRIVPDRLVTYHPRTIKFHPERSGELLENGSILQFETSMMGAHPDGKSLPRSKMIVMTHNRRFGNWYGTSIFRRAYKSWLIKDHILKGWARGLDRFGTPLLVGMAENNPVEDPEDMGTQINAVKLMLRTLASASDAAAIAVPLAQSKEMPQTDVKAVTEPNAGMGEGYHQFVLYLNKAMFRAMLLPSLLVDEGQHSGSYALSGTHFSIFEWVCYGVRDEVIEALVEQFLKPLIEINFGPQESYGSFAHREVRLTEKDSLSKVVGALADKGFVSAEDETDYQAIRQMHGMPEKPFGATGKALDLRIAEIKPQISENPIR